MFPFDMFKSEADLAERDAYNRECIRYAILRGKARAKKKYEEME